MNEVFCFECKSTEVAQYFQVGVMANDTSIQVPSINTDNVYYECIKCNGRNIVTNIEMKYLRKGQCFIFINATEKGIFECVSNHEYDMVLEFKPLCSSEVLKYSYSINHECYKVMNNRK